MTTETLLSLIAFVLVIGVIGIIATTMWKERSPVKQRLPLVTMLDAVKEELLLADRKAKEQGSAIMKLEECEFEFAIQTEVDASGKVTVWALELRAGARQTETNKIRIKYVSLPDGSIVAAR
jgi:Flp pilus assembly protein CpaB